MRNHIRGYIVVQRSPEEIKARQRILVTDVTDETEIFKTFRVHMRMHVREKSLKLTVTICYCYHREYAT